MAAAKVLAGAVPPGGVAAVKSWLQGVAAVEDVQVLSRLAMLLMRGAGETPAEGKDAPGETPVVRFARFETVATALARPIVLLEDAPKLPLEVRNCASAHVVATVVTSLTTNCEEAARLLQAPMAVAKVMAEFADVAVPIFPPLVVTRSSELAAGQA
jgi:hypothetical protein